ncbi:MAG TPA: hypothetical protein VFF53_00710 [Geobacteraceae bacterium]|nr:hypothetical protein [Geobacteraceae bacterium]
MAQRSIEELETGVDRLLAAFTRARDENLHLREQLAAMEKQQDEIRDRLDSLLARLDEAHLQ